MDLILGRFADSEIERLTDAELGELERLMDVPDPDLYAALTATGDIMPPFGGPLFERIRSFQIADRGA
jgi:antitoxin CptB